DADRLVRVVDHLMGAGRPFGGDDDRARFERLLAVGGTQGRRPRHDEEPLLAALLVVVRPRLLAGRQLVQAGTEQLRAQPPPESGDAMAIAVNLVLALPLVGAEDVERLHGAILSLDLTD